MEKEKLFSFHVPEFSNYNLEVVSFEGYEEIGELYRYEIDLISKEEDIDFDKMLQTSVYLQIHEKESEDIYIHGVLEFFEAHQKIDDFIHYKALLVPKLWWLSLAEHQEIFLDKKVPDVLESVLKDAHFTSSDYEFRLQGSYKPREYICQYRESRYDFIKRWMHREGIYFYFESDANGCKLIITDTKETQKVSPHNKEITYKPVSGLQDYEKQAISSIVYRSNNTLKSVHMRNYNYEKPSLKINVSTDTPYEEYTQTYLFGHNIKSQEEAKRLSEINRQKYQSLNKEILGESNIRSLNAGYLFSLQNYFKKGLNSEYLMVRVESSGSQKGFLTTAFSESSNETSNYTNTFMMIPATVQYRMQTTPPWPKISGILSATIDGAGSGATAELDKYGRYKVIMPFDLSGRGNAKASAYLRMAQPSAGEKQGMHFPLHKGTEVLIAFKGGDPDQPIITGAVPNINSPSPVNENNVTKNVIQTHGGNIIHMEDTPGKAYIKMAVHDDLTKLTLHNEDNNEQESGWGYQLVTSKGIDIQAGGRNEIILGEVSDTVVGGVLDIKLAEVLEIFGGAKQEIGLSRIWELVGGKKTGVAPISNHLYEKLEEVVQDVTQVTQNITNTTQNITNITQNNIDVSEEMIREAVESIVNGMNLTETLESKVSVLEQTTVTSAEVVEVAEDILAEIDTVISKTELAMVKVQSEMKLIDTVLEKVKVSGKKSDLNEVLTKFHSMSAELIVLE